MCVIQLNEFIIMMYYWLDKSMVGDDVYDILSTSVLYRPNGFRLTVQLVPRGLACKQQEL